MYTCLTYYVCSLAGGVTFLLLIWLSLEVCTWLSLWVSHPSQLQHVHFDSWQPIFGVFATLIMLATLSRLTTLLRLATLSRLDWSALFSLQSWWTLAGQDYIWPNSASKHSAWLCWEPCHSWSELHQRFTFTSAIAALIRSDTDSQQSQEECLEAVLDHMPSCQASDYQPHSQNNAKPVEWSLASLSNKAKMPLTRCWLSMCILILWK